MSWLCYLLLLVGGVAMIILAAIAFKFTIVVGVISLVLALGYLLGALVTIAVE